jgi:CheY-like chemotaxis protein
MGVAFDLLIVDDDPGQQKLFDTLLADLGLQHRCHYVLSGNLALDFLRRDAPYQDAPRPHLILLDLNLPGMNGYEVLRYIKSDLKYRAIPVVVLSSSPAMKDVDACYREYANAYVQKPTDLEGNIKLLREIDLFWSACALLPR